MSPNVIGSSATATAEEYKKKAPTYAWKSKGLGVNVWEAALQRTRHTFDTYDHIAVSFSGGKDSMCVLEAAYYVAQERGKTLTVLYSDDEIVAPPTDEYINEVRSRPGIDFHLLCIPFKQRNAASSSENSMWFPWGREERERWVRQPPEGAIQLEDVQDWYQDPLGLDGKAGGDPHDRPTFQQFMTYYVFHLFPKGRIAQLIGIRAGESLVRRKSISTERVDNYIIPGTNRMDKVYPVYDWTTHDIWTVAAQRGWNYNHAYDYMEMRGVPPQEQRVGTPFGNEALRDLHEWAESFPEIWDKVTHRVPGAAAAARYARTELYAFKDLPQKPDGVEWMDFIKSLVERHEDPAFRADAYQQLNKIVQRHFRKTTDPILEYPHPHSGCSWKLLTAVAVRGDAKERRGALAQRGDPERYAVALNAYREEQRRARAGK